MLFKSAEPVSGITAMIVLVEGQDAFEKGVLRAGNPYRADNPARRTWDEGWLIAAHRND
jgi:hypothetical protein